MEVMPPMPGLDTNRVPMQDMAEKHGEIDGVNKQGKKHREKDVQAEKKGNYMEMKKGRLRERERTGR